MSKENIALAYDAAAPARRLTLVDPDPGFAFLGMPPGKWEADSLGLPPKCPVRPVGMLGDVAYVIDTMGQLRGLEPSKFGQANISSLFAGRINYLYWAWPRMAKPKKKSDDIKVDGWKAEKVRECLQSACAARGLWRELDNVRGRGAWLSGDGSLIYHAGDHVIVDGRKIEPGEHNGKVYPAGPPLPDPILTDDHLDGQGLLRLFETWQWSRPGLDPRLLLGWVVAALVGGALSWRPVVWVVGGAGTGKTTLQHVIRAVMGSALIHASNATAAGVSQHLGYDSLGLSLDEQEAKADARQAMALIELAREAASGDLRLRGGADHKGVSFAARSAFLFSGINPPPLDDQDMSRMAMLVLQPQPLGARAPVIEDRTASQAGRRILGRLIRNWARWADTLEAYREELRRIGHTQRAADTFGTLLAAADMALYDACALAGEPSAENSYWSQLAPTQLSEIATGTPNWRACLDHLLQARPTLWRPEAPASIAGVIEDWRKGTIEDRKRHERLLALAGLGISYVERPVESGGTAPQVILDVPIRHAAVATLFEGSKWQGAPGVTGVWSHALRQAPPDIVMKDDRRPRIEGKQMRCVGVDIDGLTRLENSEA